MQFEDARVLWVRGRQSFLVRLFERTISERARHAGDDTGVPRAA